MSTYQEFGLFLITDYSDEIIESYQNREFIAEYEFKNEHSHLELDLFYNAEENQYAILICNYYSQEFAQIVTLDRINELIDSDLVIACMSICNTHIPNF